MKTPEQRLLDIKRELEQKIVAKTKVEGQLESVVKAILEKSKCKTVELAEKDLDKKGSLLEKKKKELKDSVDELEKEFYKQVND